MDQFKHSHERVVGDRYISGKNFKFFERVPGIWFWCQRNERSGRSSFRIDRDRSGTSFYTRIDRVGDKL